MCLYIFTYHYIYHYTYHYTYYKYQVYQGWVTVPAVCSRVYRKHILWGEAEGAQRGKGAFLRLRKGYFYFLGRTRHDRIHEPCYAGGSQDDFPSVEGVIKYQKIDKNDLFSGIQDVPRVVEDKEALRQDHGDKLQATQLSDLRE